jgi:hypothetical protein
MAAMTIAAWHDLLAKKNGIGPGANLLSFRRSSGDPAELFVCSTLDACVSF